ncbi:MAG: hypothetical protein HY898_20900 [Deltaproteobacteria bacterium]|nr:hypothetical protein [Deltaproteobacteria bacterium]
MHVICRVLRSSRVALLVMAAWWATDGAHTANAASPVTEECAQAFRETQKQRRDGKLRRARENAALCGKSECPEAMAAECVRWLREIDESLPSVVLGARDPSGMDVVEVKVSFDGEVLTHKLDGRAIAVDPGAHVLRFEGKDGQVVDREVVIRQGEKDRKIIVDFTGPAAVTTLFAPAPSSSQPVAVSPPAATPVMAPSTPPPQRPAAASRNVPASALVFGAAGLLGTAGFVYFGLKARSELDDLRNGCAPNCDPSDVDSARHKAWIADASLGLGLVCFGVAGWLVLREPTKQSSVRVGASPGWVGLEGRF